MRGGVAAAAARLAEHVHGWPSSVPLHQRPVPDLDVSSSSQVAFFPMDTCLIWVAGTGAEFIYDRLRYFSGSHHLGRRWRLGQLSIYHAWVHGFRVSQQIRQVQLYFRVCFARDSDLIQNFLVCPNTRMIT
jgi:hypothetical protein